MIKYKRRRTYKYNLHSDLPYTTGIRPKKDVKLDFIEISANGELFIKCGYAWDGPSGPTIDTKNFMQGSLIHDALYQLIRESVIDKNERKAADQLLRTICRDDGMSRLRSGWVYLALRMFGAQSARTDLRRAPPSAHEGV